MPPREIIVSAFLPLGPLGFGGYTILYLGKMAAKIFPVTGTIDPMAGTIAYVLGLFAALIMWGWGIYSLPWTFVAYWSDSSRSTLAGFRSCLASQDSS